MKPRAPDHSGLCIGGPFMGKLMNSRYATVICPRLDIQQAFDRIADDRPIRSRRGRYEFDAIARAWFWKGWEKEI